MPRKSTDPRVDDTVFSILSNATNHEAFSKRQIAENLGLGLAPVGAALTRLRTGEDPRVNMIGNKRGARYVANPSVATA
jgi:hypothetical protein